MDRHVADISRDNGDSVCDRVYNSFGSEGLAGFTPNNDHRALIIGKRRAEILALVVERLPMWQFKEN